MKERTEQPQRSSAMSLGGQALASVCLLLLATCYAQGVLPAVLGAPFAVALLSLLLLRGNPILACLSAGAYAAVVTLTAPFFVFLISLCVLLGGSLLARGVRKREDRASLCVSLSLSAIFFILLGVGCAVYLATPGIRASDVVPYLTEKLDAGMDSIASDAYAAFSRLAEVYEETGVKIVVPAPSELRTYLTRSLSLAPGWIVFSILALSLVATYLLQLLSLLTDKKEEEPLYPAECRVFRLGAMSAIVHLSVMVINFFYCDYSSVVSLTLLNAEAVLSPLFAFGGLGFLPRILHGMRRAEEGRAGYRVWFLLFILLCLMYVSYALLFFGVVYAISILKNAFFAQKGEKG